MNGSARNAPAIRACICGGLGSLGVHLEDNQNVIGESLIFTDHGHVQVRVIRTYDDVIIEKAVFRMPSDTQTSPARPLRGVTP